ncbi:hypothetical protein B0P06_000394 [Clostridium saccharoperbutylacetonicum]|nr:hypothetical protein [Clostridium saccharoperbutylacetonicum]NSB27137.1 hypothetical protein [Clostridium saccharoperbutylacetonicum]NSB40623.1 hypothetical protein [Clostridium saccharoperbutylacetonicum]
MPQYAPIKRVAMPQYGTYTPIKRAAMLQQRILIISVSS